MNELLLLLKKFFGYTRFRPMQEEIIQRIVAGKDALVLMPTGGGKSICFQLPAIYLPGTALVVSPLIALMKDQVEGLVANGIPAAALNSLQPEEEQQRVKQLATQGKIKLLYISGVHPIGHLKGAFPQGARCSAHRHCRQDHSTRYSDTASPDRPASVYLLIRPSQPLPQRA